MLAFIKSKTKHHLITVNTDYVLVVCPFLNIIEFEVIYDISCGIKAHADLVQLSTDNPVGHFWVFRLWVSREALFPSTTHSEDDSQLT